MTVTVLASQGYALEATVDVDGIRLTVMDDVTANAGPAPTGRLAHPRFHAAIAGPTYLRAPYVIEQTTTAPRLSPRGGWTYDATGILRWPDLLDLGFITVQVNTPFPRELNGRLVGTVIETLALRATPAPRAADGDANDTVSWPDDLAALVVDALLRAGLVHERDVPRAVAIAKEEIEVDAILRKQR